MIAEYQDGRTDHVKCSWYRDVREMTLRTILLARLGTPDQAGRQEPCFVMSWTTSDLEIGYTECDGTSPKIT